MSVQAIVKLTDGRVLNGINYRMSAGAAAVPSVPASPYPFNGGTYHIEALLGWMDLNADQVASISVRPLAH